MPISVSLLGFSKFPDSGRRLATFQLRFPRIVHAELMTHRVFSRNAQSSRAVPIRKLIREAWGRGRAAPIRFGKRAKRGMQDRGASERNIFGPFLWALAAKLAAVCAFLFDLTDSSKQVANRILEPFTHISVVVTGTYEQWQGFFALRCADDADPTIQALAETIRGVLERSRPVTRTLHSPFHEDPVRAVAALARVSYDNFGKKSTREEDAALARRLIESKHWSPFEHVVVEHWPEEVSEPNKDAPDMFDVSFHPADYGNLPVPLLQLRKAIEAGMDRVQLSTLFGIEGVALRRVVGKK